MDTLFTTYLCEDTPDGIFTAVYDAWAAKIPDDRLKLCVEDGYCYELFTDIVYVQTDLQKAVKVARSISRKISKEAYDMVYLATLSKEQDKIDVIYRFLKLGFHYGRTVVDMQADQTVCRLFDIQRGVVNEAHSFREFIRFHDSEQGILIAKSAQKASPSRSSHRILQTAFPKNISSFLMKCTGWALFMSAGNNGFSPH